MDHMMVQQQPSLSTSGISNTSVVSLSPLANTIPSKSSDCSLAPSLNPGPGLFEVSSGNVLGEPGHGEVGIRNPDQEHLFVDGDSDLELTDRP